MLGSTSNLPFLLGVAGVFGGLLVWQVVGFARLLGHSSVVLPSRLGEPLVNLRCRARIRGAKGEGGLNATWLLVTLLVTRDVLVLRTPVGDWEFPKESTSVDLGVPMRARPALHARRGALDARIYLSRDGMRTAVDHMRGAGWIVTDAPPGPAGHPV